MLEKISPACDLQGSGLPSLVIDFKKMFTIPAPELDRQVRVGHNGAQRRCRLITPYCEHLQSRAAFYLKRVGIPKPHEVEPSAQKIA